MKIQGLAACLLAAMLAACGGGGSSGSGTAFIPAAGELVQAPPRVASYSASQLTTLLQESGEGQGLLQLAGSMPCGIDMHYLQYGTLGGANEKASASGALMIPTGSATQCKGQRPLLLFAHGTAMTRSYNIANMADTGNEAYSGMLLVAALFAAQGYVVVAPNYAGYDSSSLPYHPYLNDTQEAGDMINALTATRTALPGTPAGASVSDSGKLFISGYSQGGYVALATLKAMQNASMTVTAVAPMSGPYALEAFGDALFEGNVSIGATEFSPLLVESFQHQNNADGNFAGSIYQNTSDIFSSPYASTIGNLLPSATLSEEQIFNDNLLPETVMFEQTPAAPYAALDSMSPPSPALDSFFASSGFLVNTGFRYQYVTDAEADPDGAIANTDLLPSANTPSVAFRAALKANDLRLNGGQPFVPTAPVMLCGGHGDPTVFFMNALTMAGIWQAASGSNSSLAYVLMDVDPGSGTDAYQSAGLSNQQNSYMQNMQSAAQSVFTTEASSYGSDPGTITANYHGGIVPPACSLAVQGFFSMYQ